MAADTLWSDTLDILLSNSMESSIEGPQALIPALAANLAKLGRKITRVEESHRGTKNINPHEKLFLEGGANPEVVAQVEAFLSLRGVRFTKHEVVTGPDHIDLSYDLNNVSVWRNET